jgi:heme/copper-type cytochrome/quinol oxidase subunit 1
LDLLRQGQELLAQGVCRLILGVHEIIIPQSTQDGEKLVRIFQVFTKVLNVMSSAGASILALGYVIPLVYLLWSLRYSPLAGPNPWGATGLEWQTPSPPPTDNFAVTPVVTQPPYAYETQEEAHGSSTANGGARTTAQ